MKKSLILLAVAFTTLLATAQTNQYFWYNGNLMFGTPIVQTDSITFFDVNDIDTLHLILPRTNNLIQHDTVYYTVHDTIYINNCGDDTPTTPEGALNGEFSVSATKKVRFSKGNLQYQASTTTWRFAEHQNDMVAMGYGKIDTTNYCYVGGNVLNSDNNLSDETYSGWIDLFIWGAGEDPINGYCNDAESFVDWGVNPISNGGNTKNLWRSLTMNEWNYLFNGRENAQSKYGNAKIDGITGLVILPDEWKQPSNISFSAGSIQNTQWYDWSLVVNNYTYIEWRQMEANGAVFLPAAGYIVGKKVGNAGSGGYYWSSTYYEQKQHAYILYFRANSFDPKADYSKLCGRSVRLVQETDGTQTASSTCIPDTVYITQIVHDTITINLRDTIQNNNDDENTKINNGVLNGEFSVSATKKIRFSQGNLQYQASTDTWRFAEHQYDMVGMGYGEINKGMYCYIGGNVPNSDNGDKSATYSGWIDGFGWGTGNAPTKLSKTDSDYSVFTDWGINSISNGGNTPNQWRTLTSSEWDYLITSRTGAKNKYGAASVDGITGLVILPDNWTLPNGCSFISGMTEATTFTDWSLVTNIYSTAQWSQMEAAGAVFLPTAGHSEGSVGFVGLWGFYWSSTMIHEDTPDHLRFNSYNVYPTAYNYPSSYGLSVRLVQDVK